MPYDAPSRGRQPPRNLTWPLTARARSNLTVGVIGGVRDSTSISTVPPNKHTRTHDFFDADVDRHPENYFLSPVEMYEYDDWAEDSDSDAEEEVEWDAGIADFALFDDDRRRAQQSGTPLPSRWSRVLSSQTSAFYRSVERSRTASRPASSVGMSRSSPSSSDGTVPDLTPDNSPDLHDSMDEESFHGDAPTESGRSIVPTVRITPPEGSDDNSDNDVDDDDDDDAIEEDQDLPLMFYRDKRQQQQLPPQRRHQRLRVQRPGMLYTRTLSGKAHVWRRPHSHIYPLREEPVAERRAEVDA